MSILYNLYINYKKKYLKCKKKYSQHGGYKKYKIIITIPHSVCNRTTCECCRCEKMCDLKAEQFGDILHQKLIGANYDVSIIKADTNRGTYDANRYHTGKNTLKTSNFWNRLKNAISDAHTRYTYKNIIVFDVHSFPNTSLEGKDISLLDNIPYQDLVYKLYNYIVNDKRYSVKIFDTMPGHNAIKDVLTLHPLSISTVLFEVNENITDVNKLSNIAILTVNFLDTYNI